MQVDVDKFHFLLKMEKGKASVALGSVDVTSVTLLYIVTSLTTSFLRQWTLDG